MTQAGSEAPSSSARPAKTPRLAACLLTYNHAHVLPECVASIQRQDLTDFELLVSDDCSTDDTVRVVTELLRDEPRARIVTTPHNLGMPGNSNFAVAQTSAPYIALLHHDDLYDASLFRRWIEVMESDPTIGFVSNGYATSGSDIQHISALPARSDGVTILEDMLSRWDSPFRGTALIRRSAWDAVGGMRERFGLLADVDLWMRLCARFAVGYVAEPLITVCHARPADYPSQYVVWSWARARLLYEIHADNLAAHYGTRGLRGRRQWLTFRARVTGDTGYWLAYAVAKRRWQMLATSREVDNPYELAALAWIRKGLAHLGGRGAERASGAGV